MKIYKITSPNTDLVYVGKTTLRRLNDRFAQHRCGYNNYLKGLKARTCSSIKVFEHGDCKIELIEETDDASREAYWINELNTVNVVRFTWAEGKEEYYKDYNAQRQRDVCPICNKDFRGGYLKLHMTRKHPTSSQSCSSS